MEMVALRSLLLRKQIGTMKIAHLQRVLSGSHQKLRKIRRTFSYVCDQIAQKTDTPKGTSAHLVKPQLTREKMTVLFRGVEHVAELKHDEGLVQKEIQSVIGDIEREKVTLDFLDKKVSEIHATEEEYQEEIEREDLYSTHAAPVFLNEEKANDRGAECELPAPSSHGQDYVRVVERVGEQQVALELSVEGRSILVYLNKNVFTDCVTVVVKFPEGMSGSKDLIKRVTEQLKERGYPRVMVCHH